MLHRLLAGKYKLDGRLLFASSEPFCRWWGSSAPSELETYRAIETTDGGRLDANGAAHAFYRNWFAPIGPS